MVNVALVFYVMFSSAVVFRDIICEVHLWIVHIELKKRTEE